MESQIYLIKNVKDKAKTKGEILAKIKTLVTPEATIDGNMINISKIGSWTKSSATITFVDKDKDLEVILSTAHSATNKAIGAGCILAFFGLVLVIVPWLLYDQEKNEFDKGLANVINYFINQAQG